MALEYFIKELMRREKEHYRTLMIEPRCTLHSYITTIKTCEKVRFNL